MHTSAYPEYGQGGALQYLGRTDTYDPAWAFDLTNDFGKGKVGASGGADAADAAKVTTATAPVADATTSAMAEAVPAVVDATHAASAVIDARQGGMGDLGDAAAGSKAEDTSAMAPAPAPQAGSEMVGAAPAPPDAAGPVPYGTPYAALSRNARRSLQDRLQAGDRTVTREEHARLSWDTRFRARRQEGVDDFWRQERRRLRAGEDGSRAWTEAQRADILAGRRAPRHDGEPVQAHHRYNASDYPQLANDGSTIYPATRSEHQHRWHGGDWRNTTSGQPLNPNVPEEF